MRIDPRLGAQIFRSQQQLIADEMPTGTHRARAEAWRTLARRCMRAAERHEAIANLRDETRHHLLQFAPSQRQAALQARIAEGRAVDPTDVTLGASFSAHRIAEAIVRDAVPSPATKTQLGFTDADGYVRHVEIDCDSGVGYGGLPEKP